ncbi:M13 family metallopeptidase [Floricoccus penangensis]|uniref:endopeptidase PepO n=1 Tax=Floricoccus penangensis TaxID=1859475 RepID=UPI00203E9BA9|nr:M13-type metalloendopeptidase [Floricoccus penangensis]URZ87641.1 peptidase M13 [Floricoccus penangensis]
MVRIQEDLYEAVNADWLSKAEIPGDRPRIGGFDELVINNEKTLMEDFSGFPKFDDPVMDQFLLFYKKAQDYDTRNKQGAEPVKSNLAKIEAIKDFDDLTSKFTEMVFENYGSLPFDLSVSPDMKDAIHHALYFSSPGLILPDTTYYAEDHPRKEELLNIYRENTVEIMEKFGYDKEFAEKTVDNTLKFDALLVPYVNTSEEWAQYAGLYNPVDISEFVSHIKTFNSGKLITDLIKTMPEKVLVYEKRFYENFNEIVNPENFELIKSYILAAEVRTATPYLSEELRVLGGVFGRALSGTAEARSPEKAAYDLATGIFSQAVGLYYGKKYFGEDAKNDVKYMTAQMIQVYQERLRHNDWLSKETIEKAIEKLDAMTVFVGYPDKLPKVYTEFKVGSGSIYEDSFSIGRALIRRHYGKFSENVDKTEWHMPAHMVNAYFSPDSNTIVFPAAILQAPFYSLEQTKSQNYGGIGAVIAHEISHAFDNNGALFDKYGNMENWWTEEDFKAFEDKQKLMVDEFDGLEIAGGKVNGTLVVSENIADAGGLTAAMTAALLEEDANLEELFTQWATIWRMKAHKEYQQMLLSADVHAPGKLRANVQPTNLDEFFETFDVKEGDEMWRAPEDRVKIW